MGCGASSGPTRTEPDLTRADLHNIAPAGPNAKYAFPDGKPLYATFVIYDFKEPKDREALLQFYGEKTNEHVFNPEQEKPKGLVLTKLLTEREDTDPPANKRLLVYSEWDSRESHMAHAAVGRRSGFFTSWLGLEVAEGCDGTSASHNKWTKLHDDKLVFFEWELPLKCDKQAKIGGELPAESSESPGYCCTIVYEWKKLDQLHGWLHNFIVGEDGHCATAEAEGCRVANLLVGVDTEEEMSMKSSGAPDGGSPLLAGFYEEWDSQQRQHAYAGTRVKTGFMEKWLALDTKTFKWNNLVGETADIRHWEFVMGRA